MYNFTLVLQDNCGPSTLAQKIKYQTIPRVGENIAYNDNKYEVFRVIHDLGYGEENMRTIIMVKPNETKPSQNISAPITKDEFYIL